MLRMGRYWVWHVMRARLRQRRAGCEALYGFTLHEKKGAKTTRGCGVMVGGVCMHVDMRLEATQNSRMVHGLIEIRVAYGS